MASSTQERAAAVGEAAGGKGCPAVNDINRLHGAASDGAARLHLLAGISADLAACETVGEVVDIVVTKIADALGAAVSAVMIVEADDLVLLGSRGLHGDSEQLWGRFPIAANTPAGAAARIGEPVIAAGRVEARRRFADLGDLPRDHTIVCLPMRAERSVVGVVALSFDRAWVREDNEIAFLITFADTAAQVIRRIQATATERRRAQQMTFLAEASQQLARSLDHRATLRNIANLAVPELADWCSVRLVEGADLRTVAVAHVDAGKAAWARRIEERYPPDLEAATGAGNVLRTGTSELYSVITDEMLVAACKDEEHLQLARDLNLRSAITVPLVARGRVLGLLTLVRAETPGNYGIDDLVFAEHLARRAGTAVDNALLYEQTRNIALQLQRAVLPDRLDVAAGWQVATYYEPGHRAEVGGDFYDAVHIDDDRLVVFIGDVMGHGVEAAAAMAAIRAAVHAYLSVEPDPAAVVTKLDMMFGRFHATRMATLVYGVLDARECRFDFVSAGHYPPLIVSPDGSARAVTTPPLPPLGVGGARRTAHSAPVQPDDVLVLYTDGVIERRGEIVDAGIDRLIRHADALPNGRLEDGLARLVRAVEHAPDDDVTALAVRFARRGDDG